ncbi:hypothetical protein DFH11DRAFT_1234631 [Phellopilus nigrolimitatus]|nr:hypothetical protein DFH11DRAFT_1234631 [Phellopilus nigrolimitatus]
MSSVSGYCDCDGELGAPAKPANTAPVSPSVPQRHRIQLPQESARPLLRGTLKIFRERKGKGKGGAGSNNMQKIMSLRTFVSSRHQSQTQVPQLSSSPDESPTPRAEASSPYPLGDLGAPCILCQKLRAACALLNTFARLAFSDYVMTPSQARLVLCVFERLLKLLRTASCPRVRVAVLQLPMRLREDRGHRMFLVHAAAEHKQEIYAPVRLACGVDARLAEHST